MKRPVKDIDENEESSYLHSSNKENKLFKKKVTFDDLESMGVTVQENEFKKLEDNVKSLTVENKKLKLQLNEQNYNFTYRDNQIMKIELSNMYILQEENKDLKEELGVYKSITHDERMKVFKEDNER
jgi:cell shape-determining protein MreC